MWLWLGMICRGELSLELRLIIPNKTQTVLGTLSVDATNGYKKDALENPTATIPFLEEKRTREQMAEKHKLGSQGTRIST